MADTLYRIAWETVAPAIIDKLSSGSAKIAPNGGVVYEAGRILTHLPFKAVPNTASLIAKGALPIVNMASSVVANVQLAHLQKDISQIKESMATLLSLSEANIMVTVCSSAVVVGAIVLSTMHLSKKMEELNARLINIEALLKEIGRQQLYGYINKYYSLLKSVIVFIDQDKKTIENSTIFNGILKDLIEQRHFLLTECNDLKNTMIIKSSKEHAEICYNFIQDTLHVLPYGMMIEYSLLCKLEEFIIADRYAMAFYEHYNTLKHDILKHAFNEKKNAILGRSHTLNVDKNMLQSLNKIGVDEYILAIPQGFPAQLKALEDQNKKFYIPG